MKSRYDKSVIQRDFRVREGAEARRIGKTPGPFGGRRGRRRGIGSRIVICQGDWRRRRRGEIFRLGAGGLDGVLSLFEIGIRFVWRPLLAQEEEAAEGALIHVVEAGFVAVHETEGGGGGEGREGAGDAADGVGGEVGLDGIVEEAGFDGPAAALAPEGGSHFLDEGHFDIVGGLEALDVLGHDGLEGFGGFALEDDAAREESVAAGVLCGTLLALWSFRSTGAGAVGPGSKSSPE